MILAGDCIEQMKTLETDSVDAIVTDPPYGLEFMGKDWDGFGTPLGFQTWTEQWAREALRVLKPGGHLLAFGGTRMYHRLAAGIEDAGFEIRDTLMWLYGSGFPKSHNLKDEWQGWGTALQPAVEPLVMARKPLIGTVAENVLTHSTGALNIDASRIGTEKRPLLDARNTVIPSQFGSMQGSKAIGETNLGRWPANILLDEAAAALLDEQSGVQKDGVAVKRNGSNFETNIYQSGIGKMPVGTPDSGYGGAGGASRFFYVAKASRSERNKGLEGLEQKDTQKWNGEVGKRGVGDYYPDGTLRPRTPERNIHPTVKPVQLMRYLIRLVTPKGGTVLDPFLGSGTTAVAAIEEGVAWIGCEREPEYLEIIEARVAAAQPGMDLR